MNVGVYYLPCIILVSALTPMISVALNKEENSIVYSVTRRPSGDIYTLYNSTGHIVCSEDGSPTFLVSEKRCVNNKDFFNGECS